MNVGKQIQQLRKLAGLTQEQMAEKLNVSRQTISKWEAETSFPDWESMVHISKLFSVSLDEFTLEKDERLPESNDKITIGDLVKLNQYHRKMMTILTCGFVFLMISIIGVIVISVVKTSTASIQYMLYRYIVVTDYSEGLAVETSDFYHVYAAALLAGLIGIILCLIYAAKYHHKKNN